MTSNNNKTFKDYIDLCTWEDLKTTKGAKDYMQRSLADLKRLEPKYTDETDEYNIHFSENHPDEDDDPNEKEEFVQYDAFVRREVGYVAPIGVFESAWDEMLPLKVVIDSEQTLTINEVVAAVIWQLTWKGATSEECERAWNEYFEDREHFTDENGVVFNKAKNALIKYPKELQGDYIIPDSVVRITKYAFADCAGLTSITLPASVTKIGAYAFENCTGLKSVSIPASVTKIAENAFENCTGLTSIAIPNSVETIEYKTFSGCSGLTSITIPDSVNGIIDTAFDGCTSLTAITIHPDNPAYASENGVFFNKDKSKLLFCPKRFRGDYIILNSVVEIREEAFKGCTALTSITNLESVTLPS